MVQECVCSGSEVVEHKKSWSKVERSIAMLPYVRYRPGFMGGNSRVEGFTYLQPMLSLN